MEAAYAPDIRILVDGQVRAEGLDEVEALFVAANQTWLIRDVTARDS